MARKKQGASSLKEARKFYRVKARIESDTLDREHKAGAIADLSDWPAGVLETWTAQGVIAPCLTEECDDDGQ